MTHPRWCDPARCAADDHGPHVTATPPIAIGIGRRMVTLQTQLRQGAGDTAPKMFVIIDRRTNEQSSMYAVLGLTIDQAHAYDAGIQSLLARAGSAVGNPTDS